MDGVRYIGAGARAAGGWAGAVGCCCCRELVDWVCECDSGNADTAGRAAMAPLGLLGLVPAGEVLADASVGVLVDDV